MGKTIDASISFDDLTSAARLKYIQAQNELRVCKDRVAELELKVDDLESMVESLETAVANDCIDTNIDTGIGTIGYKAPNMQDQMLMELLADLIKKNGTYKTLQALESLNIQ